MSPWQQCWSLLQKSDNQSNVFSLFEFNFYPQKQLDVKTIFIFNNTAFSRNPTWTCFLTKMTSGIVESFQFAVGIVLSLNQKRTEENNQSEKF